MVCHITNFRTRYLPIISVRRALIEAPENVATLIRVMTSRLFNLVSDHTFPTPSTAASVTSFEPTTPEFEPAYTELPLRLARKLSVLGSPRSQFGDDESDEYVKEERRVEDEPQEKPSQKLAGTEELLYLIEECFKAGVQPEEVDDMLKIMERSPQPRFVPIPKEPELEVVDTAAAERSTADEEWDSVHLTESCKLATDL